jgi:mono/diheme cytochrome c family protein/uncharacterized membrane protein
MLTHRCAVYLFALGGLLFLMSLGGRQLSAQTAVQAQRDSSRSLQRSTPRPSAQAAAGTPAARKLFRQHCVKCHGTDGTGSPARSPQPEIPDFTAASWQARRSEAQVLASILDGKGREMPSFRGKINEDQARDLVAYIRAFAPTTDKPGPKKQQGRTSPSGFEEEFRRLQKEMDKLRRQSRELSEGSADKEGSKPSDSSPHSPRSKPSDSSPHSAPSKPSPPAAARPPAPRELFGQYCVKCHRADGTGSEVRRRQPEIPNFTDPAWQARRSDAQLVASILGGKGKEMPPFREKISDDQARGLVAYVRAFAPTTDSPGQEEHEQPTPAESEEHEQPIAVEPADSEQPVAFIGKLIPWLGRFHPAAVHFPIALLTAAAVAELLRLATGKPSFDAVSRFCIWFGALTAFVAGVLGWFMGGFRLTDASWVLMTHRWLGSSAVACAGLVLVLSEVGRQEAGRRSRLWFRLSLLLVAILVLVTGFFGGALVFGLNHYTWPQ